MTIKILPKDAFDQDIHQAQQMACKSHVFITNHDQPTHDKLTGNRPKIADLLALPGTEDIELEIPKISDLAQAADFN